MAFWRQGVIAIGLSLLSLSVWAFELRQGIRILDNRFRIDHQVDSVTLLVQREAGSAPVVLIQPDGSKWYAHRHPDSVQWNVASSSDMIRILNPTPGPWQLSGKVVDGSELHMVTGVQLEAEDLPAEVYRGQRLKLLASIKGDDERIAMAEFHRQLDWRVKLESANRPGDENYGFETVFIGTYLDNGQKLDERPDDGWFTSELDFNYPTGLYQVTLSVENRVFRRERRQQLEILPQPVRIALPKGLGDNFEDYHLKLLTSPETRLEDVVVNLNVYRPNQQREQLSLVPDSFVQRVPLPMVSDYGNYLIDGDVAGTSLDGEEFYLRLPALSFYIAPPPSLALSDEVIAAKAIQLAVERESSAKDRVLKVIVLVNVVLLMVGAGVMGAWLWRRRRFASDEERQPERSELEPNQADLTRLG